MATRGTLPCGTGAPGTMLTVTLISSPGASCACAGDTLINQSAGKSTRRAITSMVAVCVNGLPSRIVVRLSKTCAMVLP